MSRRILLTTAAASALLAVSTPAVAQRPLPISPKGTAKLNISLDAMRNERADAQRMQQAQRELARREQAAISEAAQQLAAAKLAHRASGKDLTAAREAAQTSIEASLGLKKSQAEAAAAQADYNAVADPVLETLKASSEYQDVEKKSAAARAAIKELQADRSVSEASKKSRLSGLVSESLAVSNLERLTLRKDAKVNAARERLEEVQKSVAELRKKAAEKAEKDSTVTTAQQAVEAAYVSVKSAEGNLASVQAQAAAAGQRLQAGILPRKPDQGGPKKDGGKGGKKD